MTATSSASGPITRDQIRDKLKELQGDVDQVAEEAKSVALAVGAAVGVVVVIAAFWFGTRRGRKKTTIVEVRRF